MALALHNYHDANGTLPPGFEDGTWWEAVWGWSYHALPFLEQQSLRDRLASGTSGDNRTLEEVLIDGRYPNRDPDVIRVLQTPLSLFRCPSDTTAELLPEKQDNADFRPFDAINAPRDFEPSTSNYLGSKGFMYGMRCTRSDWLGCEDTGIFFIASEVSFKNISDGTSFTLLLGERDERCGAGTWIGSVSPPDINRKRGHFQVATSRWGINRPEPPLVQGLFRGCEAGFSSTHPGGANFALADASVRFISEEIDTNNGGVGTNYLPTAEFPLPENWPNDGIGLFHRLSSRDDSLAIGQEF